MIPRILPLLDDPDENAPGIAAAALARLGSKAGVPVLLERAATGEAGSLFSLNALRRPEVWMKLGARFRVDIRGLGAAEAWKRSSEAARMSLEVSGPWRDASWITKRDELREMEGRAPMIDAIEKLLEGRPYALILERDRFRIVSLADGIHFWNAWWAEVKDR